jgi:hypothetical protein
VERTNNLAGEASRAEIQDAFKGGNILTGVAVGVGVLFAAPLIRPLAKTVIKTGLLAYDQGRVAFAGLAEQTSDIVAEARHELAESVSEEQDGTADEARTTRSRNRATASTPTSPNR